MTRYRAKHSRGIRNATCTFKHCIKYKITKIKARNTKKYQLSCEIRYLALSLHTVCRNGGIGRHEGLKIPWPVMAVRVQVPLAALF